MTSLFKVVSSVATLTLRSFAKTLPVNNSSKFARQSSSLTNMCSHLLAKSQPCLLQKGPSAVSTPIMPFPVLQQCRTYKVKQALKLRCSSCYFITRQGRLFVECTAKPRHKQMQLMAKRKLFKDDYSKGTKGAIRRACFRRFKHERYYAVGNNMYSRYNWLDGKLGVTV